MEGRDKGRGGLHGGEGCMEGRDKGRGGLHGGRSCAVLYVEYVLFQNVKSEPRKAEPGRMELTKAFKAWVEAQEAGCGLTDGMLIPLVTGKNGVCCVCIQLHKLVGKEGCGWVGGGRGMRLGGRGRGMRLGGRGKRDVAGWEGEEGCS